MHIPVLKKEVIDFLSPQPGDKFIDCTVGQGGHAKEIMTLGGEVLGIDVDEKQIANNKDAMILVNDSYINLEKIARVNNFIPVKGVLADLGFSSFHTDESQKGFSFLKDEPLDMRYSSSGELTAEMIVNSWPKEDIVSILKEYGEERLARRIAEEIAESRRRERITTTFQLVEVIKKAVPKGYQNGRIHFATRTFQALRIAVNDELDNLKKLLPQMINVLDKEGRMLIISFHSLEDRIVKNFIRDKAKEGVLKILTKKPITASFEEININPRARSAKLRVAAKI